MAEHGLEAGVSSLSARSVAIFKGACAYPASAPYSPAEPYPEYPFRDVLPTGNANPAYAGVREALGLLGLCSESFGSTHWNPFETIVYPGDTVVLKPNCVRDFRETQAGDGECLITHGAVIRAVADYVYIALQGRGRIIVADAPQNDAEFEAIRSITGLDVVQQFYREHATIPLEVYDLRPETARKMDGVIVGHDRLPGDPTGYVKVDLGRQSMFSEVEHLCHRLYGAEYDTDELRRHHHDGIHEYLVSKTILSADCVISLPKLKTHKKTGVTVSLKNLVGINGNKNWLPHHREGTPAQGGDQYAEDSLLHRMEQHVVIAFKRVFPKLGPLRRVVAKPLKSLGSRVFGDTNVNTVRSGNWYGNDTTWRMVLDLNRILMYADAEGRLCDRPMRRLFTVVDGIIGGEGNGPLDPTPKQVGMILAGLNPVASDMVSARLMGFDYRKIPLLNQALRSHSHPLVMFDHDDVICRSNISSLTGRLHELAESGLRFQPHFGWRGHIERGVAE